MEQEIHFFRQHGYVVARSVIDPANLRAVEIFLRDHLEACFDVYRKFGLDPGDPAVGEALDKFLELNVPELLDKQDRDTLFGNFPQSVRLSPGLWKVAGDRSLRRLLSGILGSDDLFMHMLPSARFILPFNHHAGVPPHRDVIYNDHMTDFVTIWVPFVEIDEICGGVRVYEESMAACGSDLTTINGGPSPFWHGAQDTSGLRSTDCLLSPGDVLILHKHILHSSLPNLALHPRLSLDMRFFGSSGRTRKHYLDLQTMAVYPPFTGAQHDDI